MGHPSALNMTSVSLKLMQTQTYLLWFTYLYTSHYSLPITCYF